MTRAEEKRELLAEINELLYDLSPAQCHDLFGRLSLPSMICLKHAIENALKKAKNNEG